MNTTSQCVQAQSGTSLTAGIAARAGQWVLATVTTRSATTYPAGWTLLHESTALSSDNSSQRMAMLCQKAAADGTVTFTVNQASAARIYINLIVFADEDVAGFAYCPGSELAQNVEAASFTCARPSPVRLVWGCSAPSWKTSPTTTWQCGGLGAAVCLEPAAQARQANFIDTGSGASRTFTPDVSGTAAIIFCVEILQPRRRWLVRSEGTLYKPEKNDLTRLSATELTAALFLAQGSEDPPANAALPALPSPEVLCWQEAGAPPALTVVLSGVPEPQTLTAEVDMTDETILDIAALAGEFTGDVTVTYTADGTAHGPVPLAEFLQLDPQELFKTIGETRKLALVVQLPPGVAVKNVKITYQN